MLSSVAADLKIAEVVDGNVLVSMHISKSLFTRRDPLLSPSGAHVRELFTRAPRTAARHLEVDGVPVVIREHDLARWPSSTVKVTSPGRRRCRDGCRGHRGAGLAAVRLDGLPRLRLRPVHPDVAPPLPGPEPARQARHRADAREQAAARAPPSEAPGLHEHEERAPRELHDGVVALVQQPLDADRGAAARRSRTPAPTTRWSRA
jgi:hypothetical protein